MGPRQAAGSPRHPHTAGPSSRPNGAIVPLWVALAAAALCLQHQYRHVEGAEVSGRGVGDGKWQRAEDMQLLSGLTWWYDWGLTPDPQANFTQEFVAMAWGRRLQGGKSLQYLLDEWTPHSSTHTLLGFNEPNLHRQSNMSASDACVGWPTLVAASKRHGLRLGSPAANFCKVRGDGSQDSSCFQTPFDWFDDFFAQPGCGLDTMDFIATHKYGCNASATIEYVLQLHARYGKPVWLTEFSCGAAPPARQLAFMKEVLPVFDAMPDVIPRYAWFAARKGNAAIGANDVLITGDDDLTPLGRHYNDTTDTAGGRCRTALHAAGCQQPTVSTDQQCLVCAGWHQLQLKTAGCSALQVQAFCRVSELPSPPPPQSPLRPELGPAAL
jgi:hypothetical protein